MDSSLLHQKIPLSAGTSTTWIPQQPYANIVARKDNIRGIVCPHQLHCNYLTDRCHRCRCYQGPGLTA